MDTTLVSPPSASFERCEACDAPVDRDQRYCVACGTHRRSVADPAARYVALVSARARAARTGSSRDGAGRRRRHGPPALLTALVLAMIPVAVAIGVIAGHSGSSNQKLLQEVRSLHPQVTVKDVAAAGGTVGTTGTTGASGSSKVHGKKHGARTSGSSTRGAGKVISRTKYGSATQITGSHVTKAQEKQGAAVARQVQKAKGKRYVDTQNSLPSQVVIP